MIRKFLTAVAIVVIGVLAFAAVAGAHVEIERDGSLGADGTLHATLSVPNECENSATTSMELNLPKSPPLTSVSVAPVAGFTYANTTDPATNAVTKLTITGELGGTDEQQFALTLGSIPAGTDTVRFTALQNCASGDVIRWIESTPPGGTEPEHPAPVLEVTSSSSRTTTTTVAPGKKQSSDDSSTGVIVGVIAAVVVVGGGVAYAFTRRRR